MSRSLIISSLSFALLSAIAVPEKSVAGPIYDAKPETVMEGDTVNIQLFFDVAGVPQMTAFNGQIGSRGGTANPPALQGADQGQFNGCGFAFPSITPPVAGWACGPPLSGFIPNGNWHFATINITAGAEGQDIILARGTYTTFQTTYTYYGVPYGNSYTFTADNRGHVLVEVVPEPSVYLLLGLGLASVAILRRRHLA
jgi:hypothetical protein